MRIKFPSLNRLTVILFSSLCLFFLLANPSHAGGIAGRVTGPDGTTPIEDITVTAYQWNSDWEYWDWMGNDYTDGNGYYDIGGLAAGTYRVEFDDGSGSYLSEVYNNVSDLDSGVDIVVAAQSTRSGINASLSVASHITGRVTAPNGTTPLEGISVSAYKWNDAIDSSGYTYAGWEWVEQVSTTASGNYDVGSLAAGTYRIGFGDSSGIYLGEVYNNVADLDSGTDIVVAVQSTRSGINASLSMASHITGRVTAPNGTTPLEGIDVVAYQWREGYFDSFGSSWERMGRASTDADGNYDIGNLIAGTYRVRFSDSWHQIYVGEAYNNAPDLDSGVNIVVAAQATKSEINASLSVASHITGTVTGPNGSTPLKWIAVTAYQWNDAIDLWGGTPYAGWEEMGYDQTDSNGYFDIGGLAAGTYRVEFSDWRDGNYIDEVYNNAPNLNSGVDIVIAAQTTKSGINASLSLVETYSVGYNANGAISGAEPPAQAKVQGVNLELRTNSGNLRKTGHTFSGWNTAADGSGMNYAAGGSYIANAAVTLYAKWTPATYTVTYNGNGNTGGSTANSSHTYDVPKALTGNGYLKTGNTFAGWATSSGGSVAFSDRQSVVNLASTQDATITLYAKWISGGNGTLADAVDAPSLTWTTGGNANWFRQTATTHDGVDAAQSGAIGNSQQSWMQTTMNGPGSISFWWKVSSESNYDFLRFYIDGVEQAGAISGSVDWQHKTYSIASGSHTLEWKYIKDSSVSTGSDCGWVDKVVWTGETSSHITGRVTASNGTTPLEGISVSVYQWNLGSQDSFGLNLNWWQIGGRETDINGNYDVDGLSAGVYRVRFHDWSGKYADEAYGNVPDLNSGRDIVVLSQTTVNEINASLSMASHITGTVTGPDGILPLEGIFVFAYQWKDAIDSYGGMHYAGWECVGSDYSTDANGHYDIGSLAAGTYRVEFYVWTGSYLDEVYSNAPDLDSGIDIVVAAQATVSGINASLSLPSHITGRVTAPNGTTPLEGIEVEVYQWNQGYFDSYGIVNWQGLGWASTDADGNYDIGGLAAGTYRVRFSDWTGSYLEEVYNNAPDLDSGTDIGVAAQSIRSGINASLSVASHITGRVTASNGTTPLEGVSVTAYQWSDAILDSYGDTYYAGWKEMGTGYTDDSGNYDIGGLPAGTYRVAFDDWYENYIGKVYNGARDLDSGTDIVVAAQSTRSGINASLSLASHITGRVTGSDGVTPLEGIEVEVYQWNQGYFDSYNNIYNWQSVGWDSTDANGNYDIGGLAGGTYRIMFRDWTGSYVDEAYGNASVLDSGTDLVVAAQSTRSGINASLDLNQLTPIHRFWSHQFGAHFYIMGDAESDRIAAKYPGIWNHEDVAWYAYPAQASGTEPVHRFWSDVLGKHFYIMGDSERDRIAEKYRGIWNYETVAWYAYPNQEAGTEPVGRFWSDQFMGHFYIITQSEITRIEAKYPGVWNYEAVAYYAFTSPPDRRENKSFASVAQMDSNEGASEKIQDDRKMAVDTTSMVLDDGLLKFDVVYPLTYPDSRVTVQVYDSATEQWTSVLAVTNSPGTAVLESVQPDQDYLLEVFASNAEGGELASVYRSWFSSQLDAPASINGEGVSEAVSDGVETPTVRLRTPAADGTMTVKLYSSKVGVVQTQDGIEGGDIVELALPEWNGWYWISGGRDSDNALVLSLWVRIEAEGD